MKIDELIAGYEPLLSRLVDESDGSMYRVFYLQPNPQVELSREQVKQFQSVYVIGILERSHLACMTLLARSHRWLRACRCAMETSNILGFAASLRGFLESAADGFDIMGYLPGSLKRHFEHIYALLYKAGELDPPGIIMKELEDRLIHYAFANTHPKLSTPLPNHVAKSQAEYIREFEKFGVSEAKNLYGELCGLTHPSADSVNCFLIEGNHLVSFSAQHDDTSIEMLSRKYEECIAKVFQHSLNPALVSLAYLRRLNPDWVGPCDAEVNAIGNTKNNLEHVDTFLRSRPDSGISRSLQRLLDMLITDLGIER